MRNGDFLEVAWRDITVGDLLKVRRNEVVPADAVFLSSHSEDNSAADTCYVQTAQLDGETNLKLRSCAAATAAAFKAGDRAAAAFRGRVQCEAPNASFDKFTGLLFTEERAGGAGIPLEAENLLLRGSMLRNVDFCYALAVYTGRETKVRVRQTTRPQKVAQVESQLNKFILCLVGLLLCLCLAGTVGHVLWTQASAKHFYLGVYANSVGATLGVGHFFTFFLLNASFIPVSLYVTVRLSRSLQMLFMEWDAEMVHEEPDLLAATNGEEGRFPLRVRSMELNDELGQITHIFSDKTGTLTLNYMEFRKLLVNGRAYGLGTTQIGIDRMRRMGVDVRALEGALAAEKLRGRERGAQLPHVNFEDGSETHEGHTIGSDSRNPADGDQGSAIHDLLLHLSLNHTVLPEVMRDRGGRVTGTKLSAASPDEEAFCYAAETLGYKFLSRSQTGVCLRVRHAAKAMPFVTVPGPLPAAVLAASAAHAVGTKMSAKTAAEEGGVDVPFAVLNTLAYTQERKCMSVIVEHPVFDAATGGLAVTGGAGGTPRGHIFLYTKGADSAILPKCLPPAGAVEEEAHRRTKAVLSEWGNDGLRTLVFACRRVPREVYEPWAARYAAATQNLEELKKKKDKRPNLIDDLQRELEVDLTLQGATANEDKLQPEVPETIEQLAKAGIKIWMVTGDKQETAVNIGFATRLLTNQQRLVMCTMESAGGVQQAMKRLRVAWKRMKLEKEGRADGARALSFNPPTPTPPMSPGIALGPEEVQTGAKSGKGGAPRDALDAPGVNAVLNPASISRGDADDFAEDGDEWDLAAGPLYEAAMGHEPTAEQKNTHGDGGGAGAAGTANGLMSTPSGSMASSNPFFGGGVAGAGRSEAKRPFALVIDEHCLDEALLLKKGRDYLLGVSAACDAVVACRARPDQKARIVRLVRSGISTTRTLAGACGPPPLPPLFFSPHRRPTPAIAQWATGPTTWT
jgi:magnesium-transporting ATPase (P-type)